jgi:hypothetical protein
LRANSIRYFGCVRWFYHCQLQMQQNSISSRIVWYHINSHAPLRFWVPGAFLFSMIRQYPPFPESYRNLMWISILLCWFLIFNC